MALQGSCLCGGVRFELTGEFEPGSFCYCASCKRISGGVGTANGWAPTDSINIVDGADLATQAIEEYGVDGVGSSVVEHAAFVRRGDSGDEGGVEFDAVVEAGVEQDNVSSGSADVEARDGAQDADRRGTNHVGAEYSRSKLHHCCARRLASVTPGVTPHVTVRVTLVRCV